VDPGLCVGPVLPAGHAAIGFAPDRAVDWLHALGQTLNEADVPADKADLLGAIYERIVVAVRRSCRPA
jgi:truncated hemoglobin YjbI